MQETSPALQQEIADLEMRLQEKRAALGQSEGDNTADKEMLHEAIGEKIQEHAPEYQPKAYTQTTTPAANSTLKDDDQTYLLPELKDAVQTLVNIVFNKSLADAVKAAKGQNNPALMDAFHDIIVDQLYDTLIERNKLEKIK